MSGDVQGRIIAVVQMPPPVTGLSVVNAEMIDHFRRAGLLCEVIDVSPAAGKSGSVARLSRLGGTVRGLARLMSARTGRGATTLYMPPDSGAGIAINLVFLLLAHATGMKVVMHHHNFSYIDRSSRLMALLLRLSPPGVLHIALCQAMLDKLQARYERPWRDRDHHGVVLTNAFSVAMPEASTGKTGARLVIGHLSNLSVAKGSRRFIDIFLALRADGLEVEALMAGPIGDAETEQAIRTAEARHPDSFRWLGPVYGPDKTAFFRAIDAFVFPTAYVNEAQPVVLLEALSQGAAVLAIERGCIACDHAASPGLTATDAAFDLSVETWVRQRITAGDTGLLRDEAVLTFRTERAASQRQLDAVLSML